MRLLVVEDHAELREAVARRLRAQGHAVDEASTLVDAELFLTEHDYDAVVLDRMLGADDGVEALQRWRARGWTAPTLVLTARDAVHERIEGLQAGADDYLGKPFAMAELLARVQTIARRAGDVAAPVVMRVGDLAVDTARREVSRNGVVLPLRPKEYAVLELLVRRTGRVVTRDQLRRHCWDADASSNVEEAAIASLRRKLGKPGLIHTRRGAGYMLEVRDGD